METLIQNKKRLKKKVMFLKRKFNPDSVTKLKSSSKKKNKSKSNKKSRERYRIRRYREKLKDFIDNEAGRSVYNLSSVDIPVEDLFALELGHGFVPAPNNLHQKEETLVLEGFRFLDRLGSLDKRLSDKRKDTPKTNSESIPVIVPDTNNPGFIRDRTIPRNLVFSQPKEVNLTLNETKMVKSEFSKLNDKILNDTQSKNTTRFNLPKKARESIARLKNLVKDKVIDIRKVDKGQMILIIDYEQRLKTEELNITKISSLCSIQTSNWLENKEFAEKIMKDLFSKKFIDKNELTAVTGLLAGGVNGKLKNVDGSLKFTRIIANAELFSKQGTPYVYPLFKVHKLPMQELLQISANEVSDKIPSRLVVGMSNCQLTRVQIWLESFLTPLSKKFGDFEYIKDSNDFLIDLEKTKSVALTENWNWNHFTLFTVDVKALYPSVKFEYLKPALKYCFDSCTNWNNAVKKSLIDLILYTLENQQVYWEGKYYILNQGIPTGGKHSVPIANILLTFIVIYALNNVAGFKEVFESKLVLWKRFIDDGCGIFKGSINEFIDWYGVLQSIFNNYSLELTCDTDSYTINNNNEYFEKDHKGINFLDIEIFKSNGTIHTKEYRKETSSCSYLNVDSAHPRHTFAGIIKSQLYRLRKLCSRDIDYKEGVVNLKERCKNSGYNINLIDSILDHSNQLHRNLNSNNVKTPSNQQDIVRLITLTGTTYQHEFKKFALHMNSMLKDFKIEVVMSTGPTLGRLLFNNSNLNVNNSNTNCEPNCFICTNKLKNETGDVISSVTGQKYKIHNGISCNDGGIYVVRGKCNSQYCGKTINFGVRTEQHLMSKSTSIYHHKQSCTDCNNVGDFDITLVENLSSKGKYSLSEREFFWNNRIKGVINIQKTLKSK